MKEKIIAVAAALQKSSCRRPLLLALGLLPGLVGCATPSQPVLPAPRPVVLNAPLGNIGVVATSTVSWFDYQRPRLKGKTDDAAAWAEKALCFGGNRESLRNMHLG